MIFIAARFRIKPEYAEDWPVISGPFTEASRAEPRNLWFDWARSLEDPNEYFLLEAFADDEAGAAHVTSAHFKQAQADLPHHLAETPRIVNTNVPGQEWSELGELAVTA
jgi:quinol monooxygenase YgiN